MIIQPLGTFLIVCLFVLAFAWPWIAEETIVRKHEKEENNSTTVRLCNCKKCGYIGRISLARHAHYNRILEETVWKCPVCGGIMWQDEIIYCYKDEEESKMTSLREGGSL